MIDVYRTLIAIWQARAKPPSPADLAALQAGVDAYPRSAELARHLANFHTVAGDAARPAP